MDSLVADLFLGLSLGNCAAHGTGDTRIDCTHQNRLLHIDVHNLIDPSFGVISRLRKNSRLAEFSTGLGITDLKVICKTLGVAYSNNSTLGRWHAKITLAAQSAQKGLAVAPHSIYRSPREVKGGFKSWLPPDIKVAVVDDQAMIPRMVKMKILKCCASAQVEVYRINNTHAHMSFCENTIPDRALVWDIVILDQHMPMDDQPGTVQTGTEMMSVLKRYGCRALIVMHTGNTTTKDIAELERAGAHGVISKGTGAFTEELLGFYLAHKKKKV